MSIEEKNKKKTELNNELNIYKRKWNIVEANRQLWQNIKNRLLNGQNKSQKTFTYHLKRALISALFATALFAFPYIHFLSYIFFSFSAFHTFKMTIFGICCNKLKKGVEATDRIHERYVYKKHTIEENEEKIYQQLEHLEKFTSSINDERLFEKCIERTANLNSNEELNI